VGMRNHPLRRFFSGNWREAEGVFLTLGHGSAQSSRAFDVVVGNAGCLHQRVVVPPLIFGLEDLLRADGGREGRREGGREGGRECVDHIVIFQIHHVRLEFLGRMLLVRSN
jgi:hypothetical protein